MYPPRIEYAGITRAERAEAVATLAELERIFRRVPELANPKEFVVKKQYWGGTRPSFVQNGVAEYRLRIWFFGRLGPTRQQVASAGCACIEAIVNLAPTLGRVTLDGRPIVIEEEPGPAIPGAFATSRGLPENETESGIVKVVFTRGGASPWQPVSREAYLRTKLEDVEGPNGSGGLATPLGDQLRAQIAAMSPEEQPQPARVDRGGSLRPVGATDGTQVLTPKPDGWRVRRSPVEVHSIEVWLSGATGDKLAYPETVKAIRETFRKLDWAAIKAIVDR
jgi:hypothetical protein